MDGEKNLQVLLGSMDPELADDEFVFCFTTGSFAGIAELEPWAVISEREAFTLILEKGKAERAGFPVHAAFRRITLNVHSSLDAVGLTAAVSTRLAKAGISANVVAGYYHDHVFIQAGKAAEAMSLLKRLANANS
ncbi:MAG: ACT domain-containing protein [Spirochaetes bacterium]|nr:ACT domain-containing protein [Spirochaetota bacterium]